MIGSVSDDPDSAGSAPAAPSDHPDPAAYSATPSAAKTPTIYDVAHVAGVAPSTVSRAFARPGRVSAETAERIRQVASRLGYRTNALARALPTGRTSMIALVISDVTNPFYNEIIRGAQAAAAEAGFTMRAGTYADLGASDGA